MDDWEARYRSLLYVVSHDFGAPIRHVVSFSQLLAEKAGELEPPADTWLKHIHGAGRLAQTMIAGLNRLNRAFTTPVEIESIEIDALRPLLSNVISDGLPTDLPEDASTRSQTEPSIPGAVQCAPAQLRDALRELASNADLYGRGQTDPSPNGPDEPAISTSLDFSRDAEKLRILVSQSQNALSTEDFEKAREPFHRIGQRPSLEHIGIGLPVATALVERMGGRLECTPQGLAVQLPIAP